MVGENDTSFEVAEGQAGPRDLLTEPQRVDGLRFSLAGQGGSGSREGDEDSFERDVLHGLAKDGQLMAYRHRAFWQCMDTLKEAQDLDRMWRAGCAPWQVWE